MLQRGLERHDGLCRKRTNISSGSERGNIVSQVDKAAILVLSSWPALAAHRGRNHRLLRYHARALLLVAHPLAALYSSFQAGQCAVALHSSMAGCYRDLGRARRVGCDAGVPGRCGMTITAGTSSLGTYCYCSVLKQRRYVFTLGDNAERRTGRRKTQTKCALGSRRRKCARKRVVPGI
jgi:hypothetical protein